VMWSVGNRGGAAPVRRQWRYGRAPSGREVPEASCGMRAGKRGDWLSRGPGWQWGVRAADGPSWASWLGPDPEGNIFLFLISFSNEVKLALIQKWSFQALNF
jgi:hypothetical protein